MQCAAELELKWDGSVTIDEKETVRHGPRTETKEKVEGQWGDGMTVVEEEPWTRDLNATWPGYMTGI
jgi:hypothetical protein